MKDMAVVGCTLAVQAPVNGSASFTGPASTKVKAGGQFAYLDGTQVTVPPGATDGTCTTTAPGIGNMSATAEKVLGEDKEVLRKDDELTISAIPGILSPSGACTLDVTVKITDAGQDKTRAN